MTSAASSAHTTPCRHMSLCAINLCVSSLHKCPRPCLSFDTGSLASTMPTFFLSSAASIPLETLHTSFQIQLHVSSGFLNQIPTAQIVFLVHLSLLVPHVCFLSMSELCQELILPFLDFLNVEIFELGKGDSLKSVNSWTLLSRAVSQGILPSWCL